MREVQNRMNCSATVRDLRLTVINELTHDSLRQPLAAGAPTENVSRCLSIEALTHAAHS